MSFYFVIPSLTPKFTTINVLVSESFGLYHTRSREPLPTGTVLRPGTVGTYFSLPVLLPVSLLFSIPHHRPFTP